MKQMEYILVQILLTSNGKNQGGYVMDIWYETEVTDEDIEACPGDYYGCEICTYQKRCAFMRLEKLIDVMEKEDNTSVS